MAKIEIQSGVPLKPFTTFKIGGPARYFVNVRTAADVEQARRAAMEERAPIFVLGGGSNILVSDRGFDGLVIHPVQTGIVIEAGGSGSASFRVAAAETWDDMVGRAVEEGLWGIENLSHIPGQAAAALVQNIGAYGQQISDRLEGAEIISLRDGQVRRLSAADCGFGYRRSIFNTTAKNEFVILSLTLRLASKGQPNLDYADVKAYFAERRQNEPSLADIRQAIIRIRDRKFPFPREEKGGNVGSFFKNLLLSEGDLETLRAHLQKNFGARELERFAEIRRQPLSPPFKVPTAFLIEICGLKGYRVGGAQVNESQPLVLINQGGATAEDVLRLAGDIRRTVLARTGISLALEPELVGFKAREIEEFLGAHLSRPVS